MNTPAAVERYTAADYRQWEGDWELIDGVAYAMAPSPVIAHQDVSMQISLALSEALEDCPHCRTLYGIDVQFAEDTVVRPDVLVICHEPQGDWITLAPELIFEIISPKTARRDEVTKFQIYRDEGVSHYVIVYPDLRKAKVWQLIDGEYRKVGDFHDPPHRFYLSKCAIDIDFSRLWRRLPRSISASVAQCSASVQMGLSSTLTSNLNDQYRRVFYYFSRSLNVPELCRFYGIVIRMYLIDREHTPEHIHIKYGEYEAVMELRNFNIIDGAVPKKCRQLVREWAEFHQDELIEMWKTQNFHKIEPLE